MPKQVCAKCEATPFPSDQFSRTAPSAAENAAAELSIPMKRGMFILHRIQADMWETIMQLS